MAKITEDEAALISKAFGDPNRLAIYTQIASCEEICCMDMDAKKVISGATLSHHLKVLQDLGLIASHKEGLNIFYRIVPGRFDSYLGFLTGIAKQRSQIKIT